MTHESSTGGDSRVQSIPFGHSNIYLIQAESAYSLADAGMPNMEAKLAEVFQKMGVEPRSVQLIIATHGHLDHVGSMAHAQQMTGAQVLCHRSIADDLASGKAERAVPRNLLGRLLNLLTALMGSRFEGIHPDILVGDEFDLADHGIAGKVIHTPGHSPSSISIMLDNGEALIGDLARGEAPDEIGLGMFYEDKETLLDSLEKVAALEPRTIYLSHGTHIDNKTLRNVIEANR
jgi:hydroxyacylglutathione hydrolase